MELHVSAPLSANPGFEEEFIFYIKKIVFLQNSSQASAKLNPRSLKYVTNDQEQGYLYHDSPLANQSDNKLLKLMMNVRIKHT
jgi:hypothetical protein